MKHSFVCACFSALVMAIPTGCSMLGELSPLGPLEKSLVFYPQRYPIGNWQPDDFAHEDAWFTSEDGTKLHGWFVPHPQPRAVVLIAHGNAGNITSRSRSLQVLNRRHHLAVMMFDYRGYGKSEGKPSEKGVLQDALAARAWLANRTDVAERDIVLMGRSLGGAVMVDLAAKDGARGLVLASTFTSVPDVAAQHVSWLPVGWMMITRLDSLAKIVDYHGPLLQSHGDADRVVPYKLGQRLFEAASGPKQWIRIPGADHNDPQSEQYRQALDVFLDSLPPASGVFAGTDPAPGVFTGG